MTMPYVMMHGMQMMDIWGLPLLGASPTQTTQKTLVPETQNIAQFCQQYGPWLTAVKPLLKAGAFQQAFATYPFLHPTTVPWTPLSRPIAACTVALVTTGGLYLKASQEPFDAVNIEGDMSYRVFANQVQPQELGIAHTHYPHHFAEQDLNTILLLEHLHAFAREGIIGRFAPPVYSISGYITNAAAFVETSAAHIAAQFRTEGVDAVLLIPV